MRARLGDEDLAALLPDLIEIGDQFAETDEDLKVDVWIDMAYLFAIPLVPLMLYAFRRGALPVLLLLVLIPPEASASWWDDLWQRRDQQGYENLTQGDAAEAAQLFADERWRGVSNYRDRSYEEAVSAFEGIEAKTADDHYNLGNGLAHQGRIDEAIRAYERTLALEPEHEDAAFNKQLLESMQSNQQQQQSQGEKQESDPNSQEGQSSEGNPDASEQAPGEQQPERPPESGSSPDESPEHSEEPESQGQSDENQEDEQQENQTSEAPMESESTAQPPPVDDNDAEAARQRELIESLLRRVPDDPGGLLRQKFLYETRQRQEAGQSRSDSEEIW